MVHNDLQNYYRTVFSFSYHFKWPTDIEELIPYERDLYVMMIKEHQEKLRVEAQERMNQQKAAQSLAIRNGGR